MVEAGEEDMELASVEGPDAAGEAGDAGAAGAALDWPPDEHAASAIERTSAAEARGAKRMALLRACPAGRTPATALSAIALRTRADEGSSPDLTAHTDGRTVGTTMSEKASRSRMFGEAVEPYTTAVAGSTVVKLSISLPADLADVVRSAAATSGRTVSATIAAAIRRTIVDAEQANLDAALDAQSEENLDVARAYEPIAADLLAKLEW
jgi:hypothetical protein